MGGIKTFLSKKTPPHHFSTLCIHFEILCLSFFWAISKSVPNLRSQKSGCPESSVRVAARPSLPGHLSIWRNWERTASNLLPGIREGRVFSIREFSLPSKQIFQRSSSICKQALFKTPATSPFLLKLYIGRITPMDPIWRSSSPEGEARQGSTPGSPGGGRDCEPQLNCSFSAWVSTFLVVVKCGFVSHKCIKILLVFHEL